MTHFRIAAIILASGSGSRTGLDVPKQFLKLAGQPVLTHTLRAFARSKAVQEIVVVSHPAFIDRTQEICDSVLCAVPIKVVAGGDTRQESSFNGIMACPDATHVLVHDSVRPLISPELISTVAAGLHAHDAIDVCVPATDTIVIKAGELISSIPARSNMMLGQTPQAFRRDLIIRAHESARQAGISNATDDCGLVLRMNLPVFIAMGERTNMKITYLDDIYLAERLFQVARLQKKSDERLSTRRVKSALVLGGTKGIGKSIVSLLQQKHVNTLAVGRHTNPAVDVSSHESIQQFVERLEHAGTKFDCVIYCPGALIRKGIAEYTDSEWDLTYDTNVKGVFRFLKHVPSFLNVDGQFLVLGSSSYSLGRAGYSAYSSSKAALINLVQAAADEWPQYRFNVVSPQRAATSLRTDAFGSFEKSPSLLDPKHIAERVLKIMDTELSGMNFDVRIDAPLVQEAHA